MKRNLTHVLEDAGAHWVRPTYQLFGVSRRGEYTLILNGSAADIHHAFINNSHTYDGLEIRCMGQRVDLSTVNFSLKPV